VKVGRNDPCPCGSRKKHKACCLAKNEAAQTVDYMWQKIRVTEGELIERLLDYAVDEYGADVLSEAWDDFNFSQEEEFEPEYDPDFDYIFTPWFLFNWIPDNTDIESEEDYLPEEPIAITYLKEHPHKLDEFQKQFIETACDQPYSFFVITDVVPGQSLTIKDIFLSQEYTVKERTASELKNKGWVLYTRVLTMDGSSIMLGCATTIITPEYHSRFIEMRENCKKEFKNITTDMLHSLDDELRLIYLDIKDNRNVRPMPQLQNTDGEPFVLTNLHYDLQCTPLEAFEQLKKLSLFMNEAELLSDADYTREGKLKKVTIDWMKGNNEIHKDWDNKVLGKITIDGNFMTIEVNSEKRAQIIRKEIESLLKEKAVYKTSVVQSIDQAMEEITELQDSPEAFSRRQEQERLNQLPEVQEALRSMMEKHWASWFDQKIPALGNETPRQAAKTPLGRERLEALFMLYNSYAGNESDALQPDIQKLRVTLGLDEKG